MSRWNQHRLRPEVRRWIDKGLIEPEQGERVLALYPERGTNFWMVAFAAVGAVLILSGIILVLASNWEAIPDLVKLAGVLVLLTATFVLGTEAQQRRWPRAWEECAFLAASVLPLLGLALISQIFHVQGEASGLFLVWAVAIAPLPVLTRTGSSWVMWLAAAMLFIGTWMMEDRGWWPGHDWETFCMVFVFFGLACAAGSQLWRRAGAGHLVVIGEYWGLIVALLAGYLLGFSSDLWTTGWEGVWLLVFLASMGLVALAYHREKPNQVNLGFVFIGLTILSTFIRLIGDMLNTGLIFIVGGGVIIAGVWGLNRLRRRLIGKMS